MMTSDLLGYDEDGLPIWAMFGAEGEGDDDATDDADDDATDDASDDDDADDDADDDTKDADRKQPKSAKATAKKAAAKASAYRPPSQAEWNRTQAALKKANDEQRAARKAALDKARKEGQDEAAIAAREKATEEANGTWHPRAVRAEARSMLTDAKCKNPARLMQLIDINKVTWQDNEPLGLEDQITKLQDEWPEMFSSDDDTPPKKKKEAAPAKKVGASAGSSKKDEGDEKKDTRGAALVAARLLGTSA